MREGALRGETTQPEAVLRASLRLSGCALSGRWAGCPQAGQRALSLHRALSIRAAGWISSPLFLAVAAETGAAAG